MRYGLGLWLALAGASLIFGCSDSSTPSDDGDAGPGGADGGPGGMDAGPGGMDAGPGGEDAGGGPGDAGPPIRVDAGACEDWDPGVTFGDPIDAPANEWTFVEFPDSRCMNDTATGIGINPSDASNNVVIFMEGGGACFDFVTCIGVAHSDGFDAGTLEAIAGSSGDRGIFDRDNPDNPLRDWSYVFIPYCTGDVHAGSNPDGYNGRTQVGYDNVGYYLERLVPTFEDADRVLLTGSSAGGFGAAWNYDRVQQAFGCTRVDLLDDSGPPMADEYMKACLQQQWRDLWDLSDTVPAGCDECTNDMGGGLSNFARYLAGKYPDRQFGLLSTTEDTTIRTFFGYGYSPSCSSPMRMPADEFRAGLLDLRERLLEPYDNFESFYVEGDSHTFLGRPVGDVSTGGVGLGPWITQLLEDDPEWDDVGP